MSSRTLAVIATVALLSSVDAHGQMTKPTPRPISQQYRADCGALRGAGDQELQYSPVELLSGRLQQQDEPPAKTFNILNGCRGTVYESNNTVTQLTAGTPFDVEWVIQAPHPGTMVLSVVKPNTDSSGTITYESVAKLLTIDPFAQNSNEATSTKATIPSSVTGCGTAGACALQFYWHSDLANQTYPTCADIVMTGSESSTTAPTATLMASVADEADDCGSLDVAESDCGSLGIASSDEDCESLEIASSSDTEDAASVTNSSLDFGELDGSSYASGNVSPKSSS